MKEELTINESIPKMSVSDMVTLLSKAYSNIIKYNKRVDKFPSVMLWGPPGVGKSQGVREMAKRITEETGKKTVVTDVRLLLFNPVDLRGIPTSNVDKTLAVWLRPQIFQMDPNPEIINVLFLDELSAAPQSVQAAAYQITLDRRVGEHTLPDNCIVLAAGNRVTDRSVATKMPKALANRLMHVEIEGSFSSWFDWAERSGINNLVLDYLKANRSHLFGFNSTSDSLAFPTPRSWEMVSGILNDSGLSIEEAYPLIAGLIGPSVADSLIMYSNTHMSLDIKGIFEGKESGVPSKIDMVYKVVEEMGAMFENYLDNESAINNSIHFALKLPPDFARILFIKYESCSNKRFQEILNSNREYLVFKAKIGVLNNGN